MSLGSVTEPLETIEHFPIFRMITYESAGSACSGPCAVDPFAETTGDQNLISSLRGTRTRVAGEYVWNAYPMS
jgi:hypothetical protein